MTRSASVFSVGSRISLLLCSAAVMFWIIAAPVRGQDDPTITERSSPPMALQWKFTPGEVIAWELQTDEKVVDRQGHEFRSQRFYAYEWEVQSVDSDGRATLQVSFNRVRVQDGWFSHAFDSANDSLLEPDEKSGRLRQLDYQCRAVLNSRFTVIVRANGAVEQMMGAESIAGPMMFTPGDLPALPTEPVQVGDEWTVPIGSYVSGISQVGTGTHRLLEVNQKDERTLLQLEAKNETAALSGMPGATIESPTIATAYFDLQAGRIVEEQNTGRVAAEVSPGNRVSLEIHMTRRIVPRQTQPTEPEEPGVFIFGADSDQFQPMVIGGRRVRKTERLAGQLLMINFFHDFDESATTNVPTPDQLIGVNTRFNADEPVGVAVYAIRLEGMTLKIRLLGSGGETLADEDLAIDSSSLFANRNYEITDPGVYFVEFTLDGQHLVRVPVQVSPMRDVVVDERTQADLLSGLREEDGVVVVCKETAKIDPIDGNASIDAVHLGDVLVVDEEREGKLKVSIGAEQGWIDREAVLPLKEAHAFFTAGIARDPTVASNYYARGRTGLWMAVMLPPDSLDEDQMRTLMRAVLQDLNQAIRLDSDQALYLATRARYWIGVSLHANAIADLEQAIRLDPSDAALYTLRGTAFINLADFDQAIRDFRAAILRDPDRAQNYWFLGTAHRMKGDYAQAVTSLTKAIERDPQMIDAYRERAMSYYFSGEYDNAIADLAVAIQSAPSDAQLYLLRGSVWNGKKVFATAIEDFTRAIELNPELAEAWTYRGYAWLKQGNSKQAEHDFEKAIEVDPSNVYALLNHAGYWGRRGFYATPIADIEKVLTIDPNRHDALNKLAEILAACPNQKFRDGRRAVALATKACQLTEYRNPEYLATLAAAYAEMGNFELAIRWQQRAIQLAPEDARSDADRRLELYRRDQAYRLEQPVDVEE